MKNLNEDKASSLRKQSKIKFANIIKEFNVLKKNVLGKQNWEIFAHES